MKKLIFIGLLFISAYAQSPFCEGFKAGYVAGYCYGEYSCLEPLPPLCPLPKLGEYSFQHGYNRGFLLGLSKKRR